MPPDLTRCPGCGFTASGVTAGCAECCRRNPEQYADMARSLSEDLTRLQEIWGTRRAQYAALVMLDGEPLAGPAWSEDRSVAEQRIAAHVDRYARNPEWRGEARLLRRYVITTKPEDASDDEHER